MIQIGSVRFTTLTRSGTKIKVPADPQFFINQVINSQFHPRIATLADRIEVLNPINFDRKKFYEAAGVCIYAHRNQIRQVSKLPYADHPITLVERAVDILHVADGEELYAGLLHDVPEDTEFDLSFIRRRFGKSVSRLVDGITKIEQLGKEKLINEENIDKFVNALISDIRILRIKMIDRGINLEDAESRSEESRTRNCREALDFYVPLGIMCGFMRAARQLSDIAFKKLNPETYLQIETSNNRIIAENQPLLDNLSERIDKLFRKRMNAARSKTIEILTKPRTVYETSQIAVLRGTDASKLSDIVMMQIIVDSDADCYAMVETVHSLGTPIDRYWHDYIKDPKVNGYQSLHTGVMVGNTLVRFQIRSRKMQRMAQEGILYNAYSPSGRFNQPSLPWLNADWLRIILQNRDPHEKILLTKSLGQSKSAVVTISSPTDCRTFSHILLPRRITPLEAAIISDPCTGLKLTGATFRDTPVALTDEIKEGIGLLRLSCNSKIQYFDYFKLLKNPLARLKLIDFLTSQSEEFRNHFASQILGQELAKSFINLGDIKQIMPDDLEKMLSSIASGMFTGEEAAQFIINKLKRKRGNILSVARLELKGDEKTLTETAEAMRRVFPVDRYGFEGTKLRVSIPLRNPSQENQLSNFLGILGNKGTVRITSHSRIVPPILDDKIINPDSLFYCHQIARLAADALSEQKGEVFDIFLNSKFDYLDFPLPLSAQLGDLILENLRNSKILFFGGVKEVIYQFRKALEQSSLNLPPIIIYEKVGAGQLSTILEPLRKLSYIPGIHIRELGHSPQFLLYGLKTIFKRND